MNRILSGDDSLSFQLIIWRQQQAAVPNFQTTPFPNITGFHRRIEPSPFQCRNSYRLWPCFIHFAFSLSSLPTSHSQNHAKERWIWLRGSVWDGSACDGKSPSSKNEGLLIFFYFFQKHLHDNAMIFNRKRKWRFNVRSERPPLMRPRTVEETPLKPSSLRGRILLIFAEPAVTQKYNGKRQSINAKT